jgi:hypothetical protein
MNCPYCPGKINWTTYDNGGPTMCDDCIAAMHAEVDRMDAELAAYRAHAPIWQKAMWIVQGTINRARNGIYRWRSA